MGWSFGLLEIKQLNNMANIDHVLQLASTSNLNALNLASHISPYPCTLGSPSSIQNICPMYKKLMPIFVQKLISVRWSHHGRNQGTHHPSKWITHSGQGPLCWSCNTSSYAHWTLSYRHHYYKGCGFWWMSYQWTQYNRGTLKIGIEGSSLLNN